MPPFVSAAALVVRDGSVLMIRDTAQGMLVLPGGHLHWDESIEEGLRREVWEETGYQITLDRILDVVSHQSGLSEPGIVRTLVEAHIEGGAEHSSAEGDVVWIDLTTIDGRTDRDLKVVRHWVTVPPRPAS